MKKEYSKPVVYVESLIIDSPIASGCSADKDDMEMLISMGYFNADRDCSMDVDETEWGNDTICYHSNVQTAFMS